MIEKWEVTYSRFLKFPPLEAAEDASAACPHLHARRIPKACKESGTWLTASASADLKLIVDLYNADVVMRVQYRGRIMEEHFISKLNLSWPQVSCESGFPPRGTRVLTVTYRDDIEGVQKFAFHFLTICNLETFLNALKVYMKDARGALHTNCSSRSDVSTPQIYRPLIDFDSRTPLTSLSTSLPFSSNSEVERSTCPQDNDTYSRQLASISNFNKRKFTSENFFQQAVVEDSRVSSGQKLQTQKPVHRKMKKGSADSSLTMPKLPRFTTDADLEADNDNNRPLHAKDQEKETADHQSKMLISIDESVHIGKKAMENRIDLQRIDEFLCKPIWCDRSSDPITEDNSRCRTPTMSNHETDEASSIQNVVPSSSSIEVEQCQQHQGVSNNNHNSLEAFPPCFTALLSNCLSSSEQAATPQSPKVVEDDLKSQIARYMEDSNFQDMLMKVERVIDELGYFDVLDG